MMNTTEKINGRINGSLGSQPTSTRASDRPRTNGLIPLNPQRNVPPGTGNIKGGQKNQMYSRELSNAKFHINQKQGGNHPRNSSQHSNGSVQSGMSGYHQLNKLGQSKTSSANASVVGSDNKSLVRQALKNQKRN